MQLPPPRSPKTLPAVDPRISDAIVSRVNSTSLSDGRSVAEQEFLIWGRNRIANAKAFFRFGRSLRGAQLGYPFPSGVGNRPHFPILSVTACGTLLDVVEYRSVGSEDPGGVFLVYMEGRHMSRIATGPTAQPAAPPVKVPHEKIAMRAYEKWCKRGMPHGSDQQDWLEAEAELRSEYLRGSSTNARR